MRKRIEKRDCWKENVFSIEECLTVITDYPVEVKCETSLKCLIQRVTLL